MPCIRDELDNSQFAYVPGSGKGTITAVTSIYMHALKFLDSESGAVRIATVDLLKTFDSVTHVSVINACTHFKLSKNVIRLIISYLSNRQQRVFVNGSFSSWTNVTSGVPQGSVVGPVLFCLVMNCLKPVCDSSIFIKYADDLTILHFIRSQADDCLQKKN